MSLYWSVLELLVLRISPFPNKQHVYSVSVLSTYDSNTSNTNSEQIFITFEFFDIKILSLA